MIGCRCCVEHIEDITGYENVNYYRMWRRYLIFYNQLENSLEENTVMNYDDWRFSEIYDREKRRFSSKEKTDESCTQKQTPVD